jgi:hypothetical protein
MAKAFPDALPTVVAEVRPEKTPTTRSKQGSKSNSHPAMEDQAAAVRKHHLHNLRATGNHLGLFDLLLLQHYLPLELWKESGGLKEAMPKSEETYSTHTAYWDQGTRNINVTAYTRSSGDGGVVSEVAGTLSDQRFRDAQTILFLYHEHYQPLCLRSHLAALTAGDCPWFKVYCAQNDLR